MPIIQSAKKRVKTAQKAAVRNSKTKRTIKTAIKAFEVAIEQKDNKKATAALSEAQSAIDTAIKKNLWHKNKGARKIAQLNKQAKTAGIKLVTTKKTTTKTATKPKAAAPAKKPATKKAPVKKAPVKKAPAKKKS